MAYSLAVVVIDTETNKAIDVLHANVKAMDSLEQARLAAALMAGII